MEINVKLAGVPIAISLRHDDYHCEFEQFATDEPPIASARLSDEMLAMLQTLYPDSPTEPRVEYNEICRPVTDALLPFGRAVFHALAFKWQGKAWLVTAPSGTGKTTHYVQWKRQFPDELTVMNGDKPLIEARDDGKIWVHPSPWYGKEAMHRDDSAELGGIILLEQSKENKIVRLRPIASFDRLETQRSAADQSAVARIFAQFLFTCQNQEQVDGVCRIEEKLLRYPLWLLSNRGDLESARLCRETLKGAIR